MKISFIIPLLAILTILLYNSIPYDSVLVESYYSHGLFQWIRRIHDYTLGRSPIPVLYILFFGLVIGFALYLKNYLRFVRRELFFWKGLKRLIGHAVILVSTSIILFYWLWAFNYKRISIEQKNGLARSEISEEWLFNEFESVHDTLVALFPNKASEYDHFEVEKKIRSSLHNVLPYIGYNVSGKARVREVNPKGLLLVWSTAGVYLPFVSEGHIDDGLHPLTKPFTLAHEMSHGFGIGQESTCNFTALLACIKSSDPDIQYSGWLGYFRYLLGAVRRTNDERYKLFYNEKMNENILSDLNLIYEELQKYPDILPKLRYFLYDSYLKSHGVTEGIVSYSRVIHLASAWKKKNGSL